MLQEPISENQTRIIEGPLLAHAREQVMEQTNSWRVSPCQGPDDQSAGGLGRRRYGARIADPVPAGHRGGIECGTGHPT